LPLMQLTDWGVRPIAGDKLVSPEFLVRLRDTERALSGQFGHRITERIIFLRAQEYHLRVDNGPELWFDMRTTLDEQLLRYKTFLRSVDFNAVDAYIDLRLSDRVVAECRDGRPMVPRHKIS